MATFMTEQELNKIWDELWRDTTDRSKGSFKRGLWYGGRVSSKLGFDKGARKAIRNAPRQVFMMKITAIPAVGEYLAKVANPALDYGKVVYRDHFKEKRIASGVEGSRKIAKAAVKDLKAGEVMKVIDRNLVKLKDARNKASQKLQAYTAAKGMGDDGRIAAAEAAIRAQFEVWYYEEKIMSLAGRVQEAMDQLHRALADMHGDTANMCDQLWEDLTWVA